MTQASEPLVQRRGQRHPYTALCDPIGDEFDDPWCYCDEANRRLLARSESASAGLDGATVVRLLHSAGNTLAGWVRHMDGYGDKELAVAIDFVIAHPDPQDRLRIFEEERARLSEEPQP